jgi:hypothetical protein
MSSPAVDSVKSAAEWGACALVCIVRRVGIHMACVRAGMEVFELCRGGCEGHSRTGGASAGGRRKTSGGAVGPHSFAPCGCVHTRTHLGGRHRLDRGRQHVG